LPKAHAVSIERSTGVPVRLPWQQSLAIVALTDAPTLNVGNVSRYISFALGGLHPA